MPPLLRVENLVIDYRENRRSSFRAVDDVTFEVPTRSTVGLIGESGSGKTSIGRAVLGLVEPSGGRIEFDGDDITRRRRGDNRRLAPHLQAVFQDPYSSLDPLRTIGETLTEPMRAKGGLSRADQQQLIGTLLQRVKLPADAEGRYPAQFSGGQRQRVAIARALAVSPQLVICDEAVSALDLSTRAQVVNLLAELQNLLGVSYLFIAHDLAIVRSVCQYLVVLYRGRVMEQGPASEIYAQPRHPYTRVLLAAAPIADPVKQAERRRVRQELKQAVTARPVAESSGCPFAARCAHVADVCLKTRPVRSSVGGAELECHLYDPGSGHPEAKLTVAAAAAPLTAPGRPR